MREFYYFMFYFTILEKLFINELRKRVGRVYVSLIYRLFLVLWALYWEYEVIKCKVHGTKIRSD